MPGTFRVCHQSTTSLGLGQVQMPRPKEVVTTGAATWGSKKWYNFFCRNKVFVACQVRAYSSSLALPTYSITQIWCRFGIGQVATRTSTYEYSDRLQYIPFYKSKVIIANQVRAYASHSVSQIRRQPAECPNKHVRVFEPATVTEVGIRIVPLSRHSDGMAPHVSAETTIR